MCICVCMCVCVCVCVFRRQQSRKSSRVASGIWGVVYTVLEGWTFYVENKMNSGLTRWSQLGLASLAAVTDLKY